MNEKTREQMLKLAESLIYGIHCKSDDDSIEIQATLILELDRIATALEKLAEGVTIKLVGDAATRKVPWVAMSGSPEAVDSLDALDLPDGRRD